MNINTIIKWTATAITIGGAIAVAKNIDPLNIYLFNIGSLLWIWWGVRIRESSIVVVNAAMLAVYAYGFYLRMI